MVRQSTTSGITRVGGKLVRVPTTKRDQARFDTLIKQRDTLRRTQELKREASRLDKEFVVERFSSIKEIKASLLTIPQEIRDLMKVTLRSIDLDQDNRIKKVESFLKDTVIELGRARKRGSPTQEARQLEKIKAFREEIGKLKQGNVKSIARIVKDTVSRGEFLAEGKKLSLRARAPKGFVVADTGTKAGIKIDRETGKAIVTVVAVSRETGETFVRTSIQDLKGKRFEKVDLKDIPKEKFKISIKTLTKSQIANLGKPKSRQEGLRFLENLRLKVTEPSRKQLQVALDPFVSQQQQATTLRFQTSLGKLLDKSPSQVNKETISFALKKTSIRRIVKGETLVHSVFGPFVLKRDGSTRRITPLEKKELQGSSGVNLNPLNIGVGFFVTSANLGRFARSPNKLNTVKGIGSAILTNPQGAIEGIVQSAVDNPFYFFGESVVFGGAGKVVGAGAKASFKVGKLSLGKTRDIMKSRSTKLTDRIQSLEKTFKEAKKSADPGARLIKKEIDNLKIQRNIVDADLVDINNIIKSASEPKRVRTTLVNTNIKAVKSIENIAKRGSKKLKTLKEYQLITKEFQVRSVKPSKSDLRLASNLNKQIKKVQERSNNLKATLEKPGISDVAKKRLKLEIDQIKSSLKSAKTRVLGFQFRLKTPRLRPKTKIEVFRDVKLLGNELDKLILRQEVFFQLRKLNTKIPFTLKEIEGLLKLPRKQLVQLTNKNIGEAIQIIKSSFKTGSMTTTQLRAIISKIKSLLGKGSLKVTFKTGTKISNLITKEARVSSINKIVNDLQKVTGFTDLKIRGLLKLSNSQVIKAVGKNKANIIRQLKIIVTKRTITVGQLKTILKQVNSLFERGKFKIRGKLAKVSLSKNTKAFVDDIIRARKRTTISKTDLNKLLDKAKNKNDVTILLKKKQIDIVKTKQSLGSLEAITRDFTKPKADRVKALNQIGKQKNHLKRLEIDLKIINQRFRKVKTKIDEAQAKRRAIVGFEARARQTKSGIKISKSNVATNYKVTHKIGQIEFFIEVKVPRTAGRIKGKRGAIQKLRLPSISKIGFKKAPKLSTQAKANINQLQKAGTRNAILKNNNFRGHWRQLNNAHKINIQANNILNKNFANLSKGTKVKLDNISKIASRLEARIGISASTLAGVIVGQLAGVKNIQDPKIKLETEAITKLQNNLKIVQKLVLKEVRESDKIKKKPKSPKEREKRKAGIKPKAPPKTKAVKRLPIRAKRIKAKTIPKPLKPRLINLKAKGLRQSKESRPGYIVRVKRGNRIVAVTNLLLPLKRAINISRKITAREISASADIKRIGSTRIIDVSETILNNQFRAKRSKDPKVLIQVEKRKFRLDSPIERKGLLKARKTKKTKNNNKRSSTKKRSK